MSYAFTDTTSFASNKAKPEVAGSIQRPRRGTQLLRAIAGFARRVHSYNQTRRELDHYTDLELADIGITRPQTFAIAASMAFGWSQIH